MLDIVPVIKTKLLPFANLPQGVEKQAILLIDHLAIRIAGMIDQTGVIPCFVSVNIMRLVEIKDIDRSPAGGLRFLKQLKPPAIGFLLIDQLPAVFEEFGSLADVSAGKNPAPMDG